MRGSKEKFMGPKCLRASGRPRTTKALAKNTDSQARPELAKWEGRRLVREMEICVVNQLLAWEHREDTGGGGGGASNWEERKWGQAWLLLGPGCLHPEK